MNGPGTTSFNVGNKILNSTFEDFYLYGLYIRSQEDVEISGNDLSRSTRTPSTLYGLYFATGIGGAVVKNNRLHDFYNAAPTNTTGSYPIYLTGATGTAGKPNILANNLIYNLEHSGVLYAMYLLGTANNFWKIYHNTVVIDQPGFTGGNATRNVFLSGAQNDMEIKNNIFYLNRGSAAQFYVYMTSAATNVDFNNNVYFSPNSTNVTFGFLGGNINDFSDWQSAGFDLNGIEFNPTFTGGTGTDFYRPTVGAVKSLGTNVLSDVPEDIEGTPRTNTPDPGAFQFTPSPCTGAYNLSADSLFPGGAILSWESFGSVNEWQIDWDTCGFIPGSSTGNLDSVVSNNTNYQITLPMGQCFCVFVREKCPSGGYGVWTGPIEICVPIEYDAELLSLLKPDDLSCGDSLMEITVEIRNNGYFPITSLPISVEITGDITQTLTATYTGNLLETEVDTVVVGTVNLYNGGYINVEAFTALPNDQFTGNDTLRKDSLFIIPFQPIVTSSEFCPGETNVTIRALSMSSSRYEWYNAPTGGTPFATGDTVVAPTSSGTIYVGYMDNQDSINTIQQGGSGCGAGNMFDLTPNSTLDITGFTLRPFATQVNMPISIYVVTGGWVGTSQADWTLIESGFIANAINGQPVRYNLTNSFTVNANTTYGIYLQFNASYTVGANTYSNSDMTIVCGMGLCSPFDYCCDPRTWNGAVHYGTSACSDIRTPVTPTTLDTVHAGFTWNTVSHTVNFQNTSVNADSVVWNFAGLATATGDTVSYQFPQTDSFEVCLIAYNNCGADTICQMVWAENVSVERYGDLLDLRLFPNPTQGQISLSYTQQLKGNLQVEVIDLSGRVVINKVFVDHQGQFEHTFDLSRLASGMYQMRLRSPDGVAIRSFVIQQ